MITWLLFVCVFCAVFRCGKHMKTGWTTFFQSFSTFFVQFKPFSVISERKSTKNVWFKSSQSIRVFWPFMGHSGIITRLWSHIYKLIMPDSSKNSTLILKKSANNLVFNSIFDSIFISRSSNPTSIHQFYYSALTQLRLQSFGICLYDKFKVQNGASLIFGVY